MSESSTPMPFPSITVLNHSSTPSSTLPLELGKPPPESAAYLVHLFPQLNEDEEPSLVLGKGSIPSQLPDDLLAAIMYEPNGDIWVESYSPSKPVYVSTAATTSTRTVRHKLRISTVAGERYYAMLTGDCDIEVDGVGGSQSKIRFVYNTQESQNLSPLPQPQPVFQPPQIQVMHSLPHNPESLHEMLESTPTVIPETNPNKVYETPAVKSRHIDPNSSPRRPPDASPSRVAVRNRHGKSGSVVGGVPGTGELDVTDSESESEPFEPTAPLVMDVDTIDSTPGLQIPNRPTAPVADMGNGKTSTPPGDNIQSPPEDLDLDEDSGAPPDSLPPVFRAEDEKRKFAHEKKLKTPARLYGKKKGVPLAAIAETPAADRDGAVETEDDATPVPAPKKGAAKKRKSRSKPDENTPEIDEGSAKKKRKGKAGMPVASVEGEEVPALPSTKGKKPIAKAVKTPKSKSQVSITPTQAAGNAYNLPDTQDDESREDVPAVVPKTPKPRAKIIKKTPAAAAKKTPLTVRKSAPHTGSSASPVEEFSPPTSTLRTTDHYEGSPPRISFSNSALADDKQVLKFVRANGGKVISSSADPACNYLVVGPGELKRTPKFIIAVARGIRIVEEQWIRDSNTAGYWVDPDPYVPNDPEREKEWGCSLAAALERGHNGGCQVLAGKTVYLTPNLISHLKAVGMEDGLLGMLKAAGAEHIHKKAPRGDAEDDMLVLGKDDGEKDLATLEKGGWKVFGTSIIGLSVMRGALETGDEFVVKPSSSAGDGTQKKKRGGRKSLG
ncbi:hypothetical protein BZA05DRAFT_394395 [Tricharina praecox]|uniref:uncharacterized protein n=1 Tax=Tricharina praecox TaxID=43433 RepID=UPI0022207FD3|nr:uncharacterized protein BZA05DRAFT_394395 [Tricharina praecox]KAI5853698.1 hypothetical protein BZA05DRAFT_394395 [Tricharina praecox]